MNLLKVLILTCVICFATTGALAQSKAKLDAKQQGLSADKLLSLGDFHYRNNDVTDAADRYYRQAIRNAPGSQASGYAQYNRGSYWFRKYYVLKEQYSKVDPRALVEAEGQYYDFIDKFAKQTNTVGLLSDAEFYLALVYLQQGKREYAIGWLNRMTSEAVNQDKSVYVYKVVWSSNAADTVDRNVDAMQLANFARQTIQKSRDFNSVVFEIKRWCQRQ
jgi:tetratricopeptide (TPR) repeat protein